MFDALFEVFFRCILPLTLGTCTGALVGYLVHRKEEKK